jgi:putative phage-type endonuclease
MRILKLEQGTDEWREMRRSKIGASDIATLMTGTDRDIYELYLEKVEGKDKFQTDAMRRGSDMEAEARKWAELELRMPFDRPVCTHDECEWLMASFDGFNFNQSISLEIKCPNEVPNVLESSKSWKRYYWQVQAQLAVGGHDKAVLLAYSPTKQVQATITRNNDDIAKLVAQGAWFHNLVMTQIPPEYIQKREDAEAKEWAEAAKMLKAQIDELEEQWKILREGGIYLSGETSFECDGVKLVKAEPKASVDYKAALESLCPGADLSAFQKKSKPYWRLSVG